jgi:hypothetical protein
MIKAIGIKGNASEYINQSAGNFFLGHRLAESGGKAVSFLVENLSVQVIRNRM